MPERTEPMCCTAHLQEEQTGRLLVDSSFVEAHEAFVREECTERFRTEIGRLGEGEGGELEGVEISELVERALTSIRWVVQNRRVAARPLASLVAEHACACAYHRARYTHRPWLFDRGELMKAHPSEYQDTLDHCLDWGAWQARRPIDRDAALAYVEDRLDRLDSEVTGNLWSYLTTIVKTKLLNFLVRADPALHESPVWLGPLDDNVNPELRRQLDRRIRMTQAGSPVEDEVEQRMLEADWHRLLTHLVEQELSACGLSLPRSLDDIWLHRFAAAVKPGSRTGLNKNLARALLALVVRLAGDETDIERRGVALLKFPSEAAERDARRRGLEELLRRLDRLTGGPQRGRPSFRTPNKEIGQ